MDQRPPRYAEWLNSHFGRIAEHTDPWSLDWRFPGVGLETLPLFTCTMNNSGKDLRAFSYARLAIGLQSQLFSHFGDYAHQLPNLAVPVEMKIDAIGSPRRLYADCLVHRAPPVLGHRSQSAGNPLEYVTYMLWDESPLTLLAARSETRPAFLAMLEQALYLPNAACVESALHGFGHLRQAGLGAAARNGELETIIDRLLDARPDLAPPLRDYAIQAKSGCIL